MKKLLFSFILCIGFITTSSAQTITFKESTLDYGLVKFGGIGKKTFSFTNTGNKPLIVTDVKVTCGCTMASWTKTPVLPGKNGEVVINYDTKKTGKFNKSIEVFSNDTKASRKLLKIKGEIAKK